MATMSDNGKQPSACKRRRIKLEPPLDNNSAHEPLDTPRCQLDAQPKPSTTVKQEKTFEARPWRTHALLPRRPSLRRGDVERRHKDSVMALAADAHADSGCDNKRRLHQATKHLPVYVLYVHPSAQLGKRTQRRSLADGVLEFCGPSSPPSCIRTVTHVVVCNNATHDEAITAASQLVTKPTHPLQPLRLVRAEAVSECICLGSCKPLFETANCVVRKAVKQEPVVATSPLCQQPPLFAGKYVCFSPAPLNHPNTNVSQVLSDLAKLWEFRKACGEPAGRSASKSLTFRKAAAVVKSLPEITADNVDDLCRVPLLGSVSRAVIRDVVTGNAESEFLKQLRDPKHRALQVFASLFYVGPRTAARLFDESLLAGMTPEQLAHADLSPEALLTDALGSSPSLSETARDCYEYRFELLRKVPREEAAALTEWVVRECTKRFGPEISIECCGGFRRGKPESHDMDFLLTHPDRAVVDRLVENVVELLTEHKCLLYSRCKLGDNDDGHMRRAQQHCSSPSFPIKQGVRRGAHLDYLDKAFCVLRCPVSGQARRVDFVAVPQEQYAFALLGWTGSTTLNRSMRELAKMELNLTLTSHGLTSPGALDWRPAATERDIFNLLGVPYLPTNQRHH
eukprot:m.94631 g.94631  ORF g.94631 m.94631 type:complete len:625 (+) comp15128_c1_seq2:152-2026(+)